MCSIEGCDNPRRKRGWCNKHYARWRKHGTTSDDAVRWVVGRRGECLVCHTPVPDGSSFRRYCGWACSVLATRAGAKPRPADRPCGRCGESISLVERLASGRIVQANKRLCDDCAPRPSMRAARARLIERGEPCHLCGEPVDAALPYPDPMSPSADHIVPRSLGGSDDLSNLALAHLACNVARRNKVLESA